MKAVFLNGPPGSGKDQAAKFLTKHNIAIVHRKFATPLKRGVCAVFGYPMSFDEAEQKLGREWKETPTGDFMGMSPREACIWFSEEVMKPKFGEAVFGQMALLDAMDCGAQKIIVFSDSGFAAEAEPFLKYLGKDNCLQVKLKREGCDFDNDSRSHWELPGMQSMEIENRFDLPMYEMQVVRRIYGWAGLPVPNFG